MLDILVITEDTKLGEDIKDSLGKEDFNCRVVDNSADAREVSKRETPALLISDASLHNENVDFLNDLVSNRKLSRIPVVLMVDEESKSAALGSYDCDIYGIEIKPVEIDKLTLTVKTILRQTRRQKQSRIRERKELRGQINRLEREVRATTEDLTDAAQNFVTMLASPPSPQGIDIQHHYSPSGGFIGGDFYDFFWLDSRRLCFVVGDVSGHGIQAAVIQSMARKVISIGMRIKDGNLREALKFANEELAVDIPHGKFVAAMVGILDVVSGNWQHARCGIPHPVFQNADGSVEDIITAGVALGLKRSEDWADAIQIHRTNLDPEGRIVMFTDGIIECEMDDGEEFDYKGVHEVLKRAKLGDNVPQLLVEAAHAGHRAVDDVLIICITREGIELEDSRDLEQFASMDGDLFDIEDE
ncbi:MAG: PP2C family protein-serine/threonine phosphatase [Planctomycetota bacterium]|jgi:serine phosphatase RsbU (regulator of sigma subunit)